VTVSVDIAKAVPAGFVGFSKACNSSKAQVA